MDWDKQIQWPTGLRSSASPHDSRVTAFSSCKLTALPYSARSIILALSLTAWIPNVHAACDCSCLDDQDYSHAGKSVNSVVECVSYCDFASDVHRRSLRPWAPTCGGPQVTFTVSDWCTSQTRPSHPQTLESNGVTTRGKDGFRRGDACIKIPDSWRKVRIWCYVHRDRQDLQPCVGAETSSDCGDVPYFRREGPVLKSGNEACVRVLNQWDNDLILHFQIKAIPE